MDGRERSGHRPDQPQEDRKLCRYNAARAPRERCPAQGGIMRQGFGIAALGALVIAVIGLVGRPWGQVSGPITRLESARPAVSSAGTSSAGPAVSDLTAEETIAPPVIEAPPGRRFERGGAKLHRGERAG